jgi:hypothetical protein
MNPAVVLGEIHVTALGQIELGPGIPFTTFTAGGGAGWGELTIEWASA